MTTEDSHITIDCESVENVSEFIYLGAIFTNKYDDSREIRRIAIAKKTQPLRSRISGKIRAFHL